MCDPSHFWVDDTCGSYRGPLNEIFDGNDAVVVQPPHQPHLANHSSALRQWARTAQRSKSARGASSVSKTKGERAAARRPHFSPPNPTNSTARPRLTVSATRRSAEHKGDLATPLAFEQEARFSTQTRAASSAQRRARGAPLPHTVSDRAAYLAAVIVILEGHRLDRNLGQAHLVDACYMPINKPAKKIVRNVSRGAQNGQRGAHRQSPSPVVALCAAGRPSEGIRLGADGRGRATGMMPTGRGKGCLSYRGRRRQRNRSRAAG